MYVFQRKKKGHFGGVHFYQCKIYMYRPMCIGRVTLNIKQFIEYSEHTYISSMGRVILGLYNNKTF